MAIKLVLTDKDQTEKFVPELSEITDMVANTLIGVNINAVVEGEVENQLKNFNFEEIIGGTTKIDLVVPDEDVTDTSILETYTDDRQAGDIVIIKRLIATKTEPVSSYYSHTAYVLTEANIWEALDGNYSATNVYFPDNFKITQSFGKYNVASGESTTLSWKGKSILEAFKDALSVAVVPVASLPSLTITWKNFTAKEVGTAISTSSNVVLGTIKVDVGKYTEVVPNQASGVTFNEVVIDTYLAGIKDNSRNTTYNNISTNTTYDIVWDFGSSIPTFDEEGVSFGCDYYGDYTQGTIPTDSLGNDCEDKRISADTYGTEAAPKNSVTTTNRFIGYRNWWYGYVTDFNEASNTITRLENGDVTFNGTKLTAADKAAKTGYIPGCSATAGLASGTANKAFVVVVPTAAKLKISSGTSFGVSNVNMDATYFNKITDANLQINGVNNFTAAQYDILVYNPTDISDMTISYTLGEDK